MDRTRLAKGRLADLIPSVREELRQLPLHGQPTEIKTIAQSIDSLPRFQTSAIDATKERLRTRSSSVGASKIRTQSNELPQTQQLQSSSSALSQSSSQPTSKSLVANLKQQQLRTRSTSLNATLAGSSSLPSSSLLPEAAMTNHHSSSSSSSPTKESRKLVRSSSLLTRPTSSPLPISSFAVDDHSLPTSISQPNSPTTTTISSTSTPLSIPLPSPLSPSSSSTTTPSPMGEDSPRTSRTSATGKKTLVRSISMFSQSTSSSSSSLSSPSNNNNNNSTNNSNNTNIPPLSPLKPLLRTQSSDRLLPLIHNSGPQSPKTHFHSSDLETILIPPSSEDPSPLAVKRSEEEKDKLHRDKTDRSPLLTKLPTRSFLFDTTTSISSPLSPSIASTTLRIPSIRVMNDSEEGDLTSSEGEEDALVVVDKEEKNNNSNQKKKEKTKNNTMKDDEDRGDEEDDQNEEEDKFDEEDRDRQRIVKTKKGEEEEDPVDFLSFFQAYESSLKWNKKNTFEAYHIPQQILLDILSRLDFATLLGQAARVSKHWSTLVKTIIAERGLPSGITLKHDDPSLLEKDNPRLNKNNNNNNGRKLPSPSNNEARSVFLDRRCSCCGREESPGKDLLDETCFFHPKKAMKRCSGNCYLVCTCKATFLCCNSTRPFCTVESKHNWNYFGYWKYKEPVVFVVVTNSGGYRYHPMYGVLLECPWCCWLGFKEVEFIRSKLYHNKVTLYQALTRGLLTRSRCQHCGIETWFAILQAIKRKQPEGSFHVQLAVGPDLDQIMDEQL